MTTTEQAPPVELPAAESPEGQAILRGLFRQAWAALPPDVLDRACAAMTEGVEPDH